MAKNDDERSLDRRGFLHCMAWVGTAAVWTLQAQGQSIAVVAARDASSLTALIRPLPHYGRRSFVVFDGAKGPP